jgi:hypothetical protein
VTFVIFRRRGHFLLASPGTVLVPGSHDALQGSDMADLWTGRDDAPQDDSHRQHILSEIGARWRRISRQELASLATNDQLVAQIVDNYGIDKDVAQREVDTLMNGRNLNGWQR